MKFKTTTCAAIVAFHCIGFAFAGGEGWSSDFEASKKKATEEKKDLLLDFTGSDWCVWCQKLDKEVFSQDAFKTGVKDKFVLVTLDYPQDDSKLSDATKKQNEELGEKFGIEGYPTILLCDASGKPYAKTGYEEGGAEKYVANLDTLRGRKAKRDEAFAAAAKSEGVDKAKKLVAALKEMDLEDATVTAFYGDVVKDIKAADPKDETGFNKQLESKAKLAKFEEDLNEFAEKNDDKGALAFTEKALKEGGFEGEAKQQIAATKAMIHAHGKNYDEAIKAIEEAKAIAPDSEMGKNLDAFKARLQEMKANPKLAEQEEMDDEEDGDEKPEAAPAPATADKPAEKDATPEKAEKK